MLLLIYPMLILSVFGILTPIISRLAERLSLKNIGGAWAFFGFLIALIADIRLINPLRREGVLLFTIGSSAKPPIAGFLAVDWLGYFFSLLFITLGLISSLYSLDYMSHDNGLEEYYSLLLLMVAGMVGLAFAGDFITFYVFWEIMSLTSYCLVGFRRHKWEAIEAGFKYLAMSATGTTIVLFSLSLIYGITGTLSFAHIAASLLKAPPSPLFSMIFILLIIGFCVKTAAVPFHFWLPDAHQVAPSSISAMLSGVVTKTGIYALIRTLYLIFSLSTVNFTFLFAVLSVLTMTVGNVLALLQKDVKRLLACSTIGHMGYILLALSLGTVNGLTGGILHVFNHAIMKGLAFLCIGAIIYVTGSRNIDDLIGVGRRMPITSITFAISLLSLSGVPFFNGFISKYLIFTAALEAKAYLLTVIGLLNSGLSVVYYLRLIQLLMLRKPSGKIAKVKEAPIFILIPLIVMAFLCILFGVWPEPVYKFAREAAIAAYSKIQYILAVTKA